MSVILGINAFHAGASAALLVDGTPVAAIAEERLNRVKYYARFPALAVRRCLDMAGLTLADVDHVAFGRDSSANREKKIVYALSNPTRLLNLIKIQRAKSAAEDLKTLLATECDFDPAQLHFQEHHIEHHLAHIASAWFTSHWESAAGFSIDGSGDFVTCMIARCEGDEITPLHRTYVPHSLGSLYTMLCEFIGYGRYGDEGKVMGLAPYGTPRYEREVADMIHLTDDGMKLNDEYFLPFGSTQGLVINDRGEVEVERHYSDKVIELFGQPRDPEAEITQRDMDLAWAMQRTFEKAYFHMLNLCHRLVPSERVAMAGGCVLNSVANGKMFQTTPFRQTWIQPAAGDEGLALGSALYVSRSVLHETQRYVMGDSYLGPSYEDAAIQRELEARGLQAERLNADALVDAVAEEMAQGNVVGWFQGRMEWGPRALGNRSIVVHPGLPNMKDILNARIKRREFFRPFAPAVLAERQSEIFDYDHPSPFMLHVYKIRPEWRERLCAVNHVDNTGRLQTVERSENPLYYDLIRAFERKTGIPVILNTSFNENEPVVCTPAEAIDCFLRTKMDVLAIGPYLCRKR